MDDLNKNQIVLLVLLVSFVTSIATGIVTVTLMDQAPAGVTQTVNRIVERTVERVVPGEPTERTVIREVPVLVSQEEVILDIVRNAELSVVRVADARGDLAYGSGFVIDSQGTVVTAAHLLPQDRRTRGISIFFRNGERVEMTLAKISSERDIAILKPADPARFTAAVTSLIAAVSQATSTSPAPVWRPLELALDTNIISGQTVVALGMSENDPIVSGGLVSAVTSVPDAPSAKFIKTNAINTSNIGGPLLNTKGFVVGLGVEVGSALAANALASFANAN